MKKSIILLIVFSLLFVSCKSPSGEKTNENKVEDTTATDESKNDVAEDKDTKDIDEQADEKEPEDDKEEVNPEGDYKITIDGNEYGTVHSPDGKLFNIDELNKAYVKFWKEGKYKADKALDFITDYTKKISDDEILYGAFPETQDFYMTYNQIYNISYYAVLSGEDFSEVQYKKHYPGEAKIIDGTLYFDINYLKNIFAFKYELDPMKKEIAIDSNGEFNNELKTIYNNNYDSIEDLFEVNFGK